MPRRQSAAAPATPGPARQAGGPSSHQTTAPPPVQGNHLALDAGLIPALPNTPAGRTLHHPGYRRRSPRRKWHLHPARPPRVRSPRAANVASFDHHESPGAINFPDSLPETRVPPAPPLPATSIPDTVPSRAGAPPPPGPAAVRSRAHHAGLPRKVQPSRTRPRSSVSSRPAQHAGTTDFPAPGDRRFGPQPGTRACCISVRIVTMVNRVDGQPPPAPHLSVEHRLLWSAPPSTRPTDDVPSSWYDSSLHFPRFLGYAISISVGCLDDARRNACTVSTLSALVVWGAIHV